MSNEQKRVLAAVAVVAAAVYIGQPPYWHILLIACAILFVISVFLYAK
jgi:hypothetical protein